MAIEVFTDTYLEDRYFHLIDYIVFKIMYPVKYVLHLMVFDLSSKTRNANHLTNAMEIPYHKLNEM